MGAQIAPNKPACSNGHDAAVIVFGRDEAGKPHASCFAPADEQMALRAAALMGFTALRVQQGATGFATQLPAGKLFASGKAFVPFVKRSTAEELERYATEAPDRVIALPAIASVEKSAASGMAASLPPMIDATEDQPKNWSGIKPGARVLAVDDPEDGWWEAIVQHVHESGTKGHPKTMLTLRWEHFEDEPAFVRPITQIAMFHPGYHAEPADQAPATESDVGPTGQAEAEG